MTSLLGRCVELMWNNLFYVNFTQRCFNISLNLKAWIKFIPAFYRNHGMIHQFPANNNQNHNSPDCINFNSKIKQSFAELSVEPSAVRCVVCQCWTPAQPDYDPARARSIELTRAPILITWGRVCGCGRGWNELIMVPNSDGASFHWLNLNNHRWRNCIVK